MRADLKKLNLKFLTFILANILAIYMNVFLYPSLFLKYLERDPTREGKLCRAMWEDKRFQNLGYEAKSYLANKGHRKFLGNAKIYQTFIFNWLNPVTNFFVG